MRFKKPKPLDFTLLRITCDPAQFSFATTDELPDLAEFVGQTRALKATDFGIGIEREGFNIFALGPAGIGKRTIIQSLIRKEAAHKPAAKDICYIHNFASPRHPKALLLKPGLGRQLAKDMQELIDILRSSIPAIFESEAYRLAIKEIQDASREKRSSALAKLEKEAEESGLTIMPTAQGFMLAAMKDGEMVSEQDFAKLPKEEREAKEALMQKIHGELMNFLELIPGWHKEAREKIKETAKNFTMLEVGSVIDEVKKKYEDQPDIAAYLSDVQKAIMENPAEFRKDEGAPSNVLGIPEKPSFTRYRVNVLVDNGDQHSAPIIYEDNPTFSNLIGRTDHIAQFGALVTDFTLLRAGALHKANGGYLLIDALKLLTQPYAYDGLKRALSARTITIENLSQMLGILGSVSIEPEPVPLDIKIILLGERYLYYLLSAHDPQFLELFKVAADFDEEMDRTTQNAFLLAQLLKSLAKKDALRPLTKEAVARVVDYGSRIVEDNQKLSTHVTNLADLLREADYWASDDHDSIIDLEHIEKAIAQKIYRASRIKQKLYEQIKRGRLFIDTNGSHVGQINGLSYIQLGGFAFGEPVRITARVRVGEGEVIDIEREVKLGGPIHSKGVLILTGYLAGRYVKDLPLSLSASLVFEQSYAGVEGDSASAAEACVLLSAIANIPINQGLAITGSMNQQGQVQPIGGVNEKIEGFFDICQAQGGHADQGVIIPKANISNLMLRSDVVSAVRHGSFHIFAVETIDEAMEILTGINAGTPNKAGKYPEGSLNYLVENRLLQMAKLSMQKRRKI